MTHIIQNILSIEKYLNDLSGTIKFSYIFKPLYCPHCHKRGCLWSHGHYNRKTDRQGHPSLNPIPIFRFYCHLCHHTCSVLPECIAPRRWYLWQTQEDCLKAFFNGDKAQRIEKQFPPSRQTVMRWLHWAFDRFKEFRLDIQSRFSVLGYENEAFGWWKTLLQKISLSATMVILNRMGVNVP